MEIDLDDGERSAVLDRDLVEAQLTAQHIAISDQFALEHQMLDEADLAGVVILEHAWQLVGGKVR